MTLIAMERGTQRLAEPSRVIGAWTGSNGCVVVYRDEVRAAVAAGEPLFDELANRADRCGTQPGSTLS